MTDARLELDRREHEWISYVADEKDKDKDTVERTKLSVEVRFYHEVTWKLSPLNNRITVTPFRARPWLFQGYSVDGGSTRFPQTFSRLGCMRIFDVVVRECPLGAKPVKTLRRALRAVLGDDVCVETRLSLFDRSSFYDPFELTSQDIEGLKRTITTTSVLEWKEMESLASLAERVAVASAGDGTDDSVTLQHARYDLAFLDANAESGRRLRCLYEDLEPSPHAPTDWKIDEELTGEAVYPAPVPLSYLGDPLGASEVNVAWSELP